MLAVCATVLARSLSTQPLIFKQFATRTSTKDTTRYSKTISLEAPHDRQWIGFEYKNKNGEKGRKRQLA